MNGRQIAGLVLIGASLLLFFGPPKFPGLSSPSVPDEYKPLVPQVKAAMNGENASEDAQNLAGCLRAAANQFNLDLTRPKPYYSDNESLKWSIKTIGDLSFPIGWKMTDKYPQLPSTLEAWLKTRLGEDFTRQDLIRELRGLAVVLEQV